MAKYLHQHGGVGAPVGLTVFKTAEGSLGAVPGGFDSHTPLPPVVNLLKNGQSTVIMDNDNCISVLATLLLHDIIV